MISAKSETRQFYRTLHVLRGVAAVSVMLLHVRMWRMWRTGRLDATYPYEEWLYHLGYGGVYLFFVLSGFFMVHVSRRTGLEACLRFLWARFARTAPPYWAVLIGVALLYAYDDRAVALQGIGLDRHDWHWLWANATVRNLQLLPVAWTLYYEWVFYGVFALTYVLLGPAVWVGTALAWMTSMASHPDAAWQLQHIQSATWYISTNSFGLILGTGLGWIAPRIHPRSILAIALPGVVGVLLVVAYTYRFVLTSGDGRLMEIIWPLVWAPVVLSGAGWDRRYVRIPYPRALLWAGDASYTIYLTHQPAIWIAFILMGYQSSAWAFLPLFATILGLAWIWHRIVERPLVSRFRQLGARVRIS